MQEIIKDVYEWEVKDHNRFVCSYFGPRKEHKMITTKHIFIACHMNLCRTSTGTELQEIKIKDRIIMGHSLQEVSWFKNVFNGTRGSCKRF